MKKWIRYILVSFLLLAAFPSFIISAEETDSSGKLTANGTNLLVELTIPQGKTENEADKITSLHFRIYVSIDSGSMEEPTFQFASTIDSKVKDVKTIKDNYSNYMMDIILSGTKNQDIFKNSTGAEIGTLSLHPTTSTYKISANFAGSTADSKEPFAEYVTSMGQTAQTVLLKNTEIITAEASSSGSSTPSGGNSGGSTSSGSGPTISTTPLVPDTPSVDDNTNKGDGEPNVVPPGNTGNTNTPSDNTQTPSNPAGPGSSQQTFDSAKKPKAEVTSKKGKKRISFQWESVDGAEGYMVYQYNPNTEKYKRIKTISDPAKTTFQKKMKYGMSYSFKIRAFATAEDGNRTFGKYSPIINITTAPAKVKGLKIKSAGASKVTLSWKKVSRAKGYQIFRSKKKNGNYTLVKTLKKSSALNTAIKQKGSQAYYYKIRAFVKNADKKRVYGNFSKTKKS